MRRDAKKDAGTAQKIALRRLAVNVALNRDCFLLVLNLEQINRRSSNSTLLLQTVDN